MGTGRVDSLLLVEDDPEFAALTKLHLEQRGRFEIDTAGTGRDALSQITTRQYDCIVSDYDMPKMNGIELLDAVRETDPGCSKREERYGGETISGDP